MASNFIMPSSLIGPANLCIGGLTTSTHHPLGDFIQSNPSPTASDLNCTLEENFDLVQKDGAAISFKVQLTRLLTSWMGIGNSENNILESKRAATYQLLNSGGWFENSCASAKTRDWIEKMIANGRKIYCVVGYHTLIDAKYAEQVASSVKAGLKATVPTETTMGPIWGGMLDVGVTATVAVGKESRHSYFVPGEMVYAIQYRRVKTPSFKRKDVSSAILEKSNRWVVLSKVERVHRGAQVDEEKEGDELDDEILEARLTDEWVEKSKKLNHDKVQVGSVEYEFEIPV